MLSFLLANIFLILFWVAMLVIVIHVFIADGGPVWVQSQWFRLVRWYKSR